jgi:hypothetical protein
MWRAGSDAGTGAPHLAPKAPLQSASQQAANFEYPRLAQISLYGTARRGD